MTLEEIIKEKHARLESVPTAFESAIVKAQKQVLKELTIELGSLKKDQYGYILTDSENLTRIAEIGQKLSNVLSQKEYGKAVEAFLSEFQPQAEINNKYFNRAFPGLFSDNEIYQKNIEIARDNTALLLKEDVISAVFIQPINMQLIASINGNTNYRQALDAAELFIKGNKDVDGGLLKYAKQNVFDAFSIFDRAYANIIAQDLAVEFYLNSGGLVRDSRCICKELNGTYRHRKEVEAIGAGAEVIGDCGYPWQGMRKGTNSATIFSFAEGYNCHHTWLPVPTFSVPEMWIERAIEKGYYKKP